MRVCINWYFQKSKMLGSYGNQDSCWYFKKMVQDVFLNTFWNHCWVSSQAEIPGIFDFWKDQLVCKVHMYNLHFKLNHSTFAEQVRKSSQFHFNVLKMQTIILLNFGCMHACSLMLLQYFLAKNSMLYQVVFMTKLKYEIFYYYVFFLFNK